MNALLPRFVLLLTITLAASICAPAEITVKENSAVGPGDTALEGQDVIVEGATLTLAGAHAFRSLQLTKGAVLTHPAAPTGQAENAIRLSLTGDLHIDAASRIDVTGRGYAEAGSPGAASRGDYAGAGGGHGARGARSGGSGGQGGAPFGSVVAPDSWGGPGANGNNSAFAPGGGLVHVEVGGTATIDGSIRVDGASAAVDNQGGGAGGSLFLRAESIQGAGTISANGGAGEWVDGGGGAGGRMALLHNGGSFSGVLEAKGAGGAAVGGAGTVYVKRGTAAGEVRIANGRGGEWTPLEAPVPFDLVVGANAVVYPTSPLALGSLTIAAGGTLTHENGSTGVVVQASGQVTIEKDGALNVDGRGFGAGTDPGPGAGTKGDWAGSGASHAGLGGASATRIAGGVHYGDVLRPVALGSQGGAGSGGPGGYGGGCVHLMVAGRLTVEGRLSAEGGGARGDNAGGGSGGSIWVTADSIGGAGSISANGGPGEWVDGGGGGGGRIALYYTTSDFSGGITAIGAGGSSRAGAGTIYRRNAANSEGGLLVSNGGAWGNLTPLTSPEAFRLTLEACAVAYAETPLQLARLEVLDDTVLTHLTGQTNLQVEVRGDAVIADGGLISADGKGYPILFDRGPGMGLPADWAGSGGGHGGLGGHSATGQEGGSTYGSMLQPTHLGSQGGDGSGGVGGAGGGAVRLVVVGRLTVDGRLSAEGASTPVNNAGGGSGGSLWVTAGSLSGSGVMSVNGGAGEWVDGGGGGGGRVALYFGAKDFSGSITAYGGGGSERAGAGTIYQRQQGAAFGQLLVDNGDVWGNYTPLTSPEAFQLIIAQRASVYAQAAMTVQSLEVRTNASLAHLVGQTNLSVHALGDMVIANGGVVHADGRGFPVGEVGGPGMGALKDWAGSGGSHGGLGGVSATGGPGGTNYGSILEPVARGSQGGFGNDGPGSAGGGAIRLVVDGALRVDGRLSANGLDSRVNNSGGGSGGSIWVTAGSLAGTGTISVNGGGGEWVDGGGGGGGRIALYYGSSSFAGDLWARGAGGSQKGGAGTIYQRTHGTAFGQLLISNGGVWGNTTPLTSPEPFQLTLAEMAHVYPESALTLRDLEVRTNAVLTHLTGQARCEVHVLNNLTVAAGGVIGADGRGYPVGADDGPGAGTLSADTSTGSGGGHGGRGGSSAEGTPGGLPYGSHTEPLTAGSRGGPGSGGAGGAGGGVLRLIVDNQFRLDGQLTANGLNAPVNNSGGGAGGSIFITAHTFSGAGVIAVDGGSGEWVDGGGGAGGRVALHLQQDSFAGPIYARGGGGSARGGAGTLYKRMGAETGGALVLDNGGNPGALTPLDVPPSTRLVLAGGTTVYPVGKLDVVSLRVKPGSTLTHTNGQSALTINVAEDFVLEAGATLTAAGKGYPLGTDNGPGAGATGESCGGGGAYGGNGGLAWPGDVPGGVGYGSILEPVDYGSSGGAGGGPANARCPGGGAIRIVVGGALTLDGTVTADGSSAWYNNQGAGAGGSVWITAARLLGVGGVSASGGNGEWVDGGGGGGGRVALHVDALEFSGTLSARGGGGHQAGGAGTVYTRLKGQAVGTVLVENGDRWGAYTRMTTPEAFHLEVQKRAQIYGDGTLMVGSLQTLPETVLTHLKGQDAFSAVVVGDATLGGAIDVSGLGYPIGEDRGPGAGGQQDWSGSGAGHGGLGGRSATGLAGGTDYGSASEPTQLGSQGGAGSGGWGGHGGGAVRLIVGKTLAVNGSITANGLNGSANNSGGGSGGSILLSARSFVGSGSIAANGGSGEWVDGGGGAGGRIALYRTGDSFSGTLAVTGGGGSARAEDGSIHKGSIVGIIWLAPAEEWLNGQVKLEAALFAGSEGEATVEFAAWRDGIRTLIGRTQAVLAASVPWDTRTVVDGIHELEVVMFNNSGARIAESRRTVWVQNSVTWHGGTLGASETWAAGRVHVVQRDLVVPAGVTLTMAPGVVVKFLPGTRLVLNGGAKVVSSASAAQPVVLTSFLDDSAGGDSNLDATTTRPLPGAWRLVLNASASFAHDDTTRFRFQTQSYGGALAKSETWTADSLREVTETVTVPDGVTLRIEGGSIIKFASGQGLTVSAGGKLEVAGSLAQPAVFTSQRDDAFGGDSNDDGSRTTPQAGDWRSLRIADGASATLDHALIRFGGNSVGNPWGAGGAIEALGGSLTVRNSVISDALKDGAFCYGATRFENSLVLRCDRGLTAVGTMDVVHCTIDACRIGLLEHVGQLNVQNSIVSRSIDAGIEHDLGGGRPVVTSCNVWNPDARRGNYSGIPDPTGRDGNISAQPRYKDADGDNFRLNFTSPGIDAAAGAVAPVTDFAGSPRYDDPRTGNTGTPAANGAVPDMGAFEFNESAPSNLDLAVASVNGPGRLTAGEMVHVEWTILNRGGEAFTGPWHDALYLQHAATGQKLKVGEVLVGRAATLGPGQTLTSGADVRVPGGVVAEYRWVVEANSRGDVFEGANATNNEGAAGAYSSLTVPAVPLDGAAAIDAFGAQEEQHWFQVLAPAGKDMRVAVDLASNQGVTEIYLGRGFMPTPDSFTERQREFGAADTSAIASGAGDVTGPGETNVFYVLVVGRVLAATPSEFRVSATSAAFSIEGAANNPVGNSGEVTLDIRGSGFTTNTVFTVRSGGLEKVGLRQSVRESGRAFVTFDLGGLPSGAAALAATLEGLTVTLPDAVQILEGGTADFHVSLSGPSTTRAGRFTTWFVTYGNRGLVDLKLPLLKFSAPGASEIQLYESTLNWAPEFTFLGMNPEVLLPTLGPGQEVTFEVRVKTMSGVTLSLSMITGEQFAADTTPFAWESIPPTAGVDPAKWAEMVHGLNARLGVTAGDYARLVMTDLADLADSPLRFSYLASINGRWLFGDEPEGLSTVRPLNLVSEDYQEPQFAPSLHVVPAAKPADGIRKTWWVVISVEDYSTLDRNDPKYHWSNLRGTRKDALDLMDYARKDLRTPDDQYLWAHDVPGDRKDVRRSTMLAGLAALKGKADADDNVVVVFSGHGALTDVSGSPYIAFNGDLMSPVAFTSAIDEIGAGTTYFVNDSCHSEAFNEAVQPTHTKFVGFAGTQSKKISHDTAAGGELIKNLKGQLRKCRSLGLSMELTTAMVTKKYENEADEKDRQQPVLTNPSGTSLEGKPWNDPSGFEQILRQRLNSLRFNPWAQAVLNIVGSVDPNEKYALAGVGPQHWVQPDQVLPFQVLFENKTNAAAPAQEVLVTDDLDPRFDWSTFELKSVVFNDAKLEIPAGRQRFTATTQVGTDRYPVDVELSLNPVSGRITCLIRSRDPATGDLPEDPFAGFLPPNDATHRGEGSFTYTIRTRPGLPDGSVLANQANIIFDPTYAANPPILTPVAINTIDGLAPSSIIQPLPPAAIGEVAIQWSGTDAPNGSGIGSYDVYVSRDNGPYTPWLLAVTETVARFLGEPGSTYRFYSVARDRAGNTEPAPSQPDATVAIAGSVGPVAISLLADGRVQVTFSGGVLQTAPSIQGPWTDLINVTSPYAVVPSSNARFFRARQ